MSKFKVGDKVRTISFEVLQEISEYQDIYNPEWYHMHSGNCMSKGMAELQDIFTIASYDGNGEYSLAETGYAWTDDMLIRHGPTLDLVDIYKVF